MNEPTLEQVMAKIRSVFPQKAEQEVLTQLEAYGEQSHEQEKYRVFLAILKLSEEEGLADPSHYIEAAKQDYRDVLYWAEYPNEVESPTWNADAETKRRNSKLDSEQYQEWLSKP